MSILPAAQGLLALLVVTALARTLAASQAVHRDLTNVREQHLGIIKGTDVGTLEWDVETDVVLLNERCTQFVGASWWYLPAPHQ